MFERMNVGTRLLSGFSAVAVAGAVVAAIGIFNMGRMNEDAQTLYEKDLLGLSYSKEANVKVIDVGRALRSAMLASQKADRTRFIEKARKNYADMVDNLNNARPRFYTERGKAAFQAVDDEVQAYKSVMDELINRIEHEDVQQQRESVEFLFTQFAPRSNRIDEKLDGLVDTKEKNAARFIADAATTYKDSRNLMIGLVLCSLVLGIGIGIMITRRLTRQLGGEPDYAAGIADRIADGDLTVEVDVRSDDRTSMLFAMKRMRDSLVNIVAEVRVGTGAIATASGQIAAGNLDLSSRTEQQASTLEETASSMEELTSTVRQNADNARQANQLAGDASAVAVRGGTAVADVVNTMSAINESARRIVEIIGVIDGIAFQTNILALNAAVEAARAGEQGRGFAVVASEVRNLAQRSAGAAKEIKALIGESVEKVESGAKLVDQAGNTMEAVVQSVQRVSNIISEISQASQEQSSGIEQINQAVLQMDHVTQQNASLVEEAAAASEALQEQARRLSELVSFFQIAEPQAAGARAPAALQVAAALPKPSASASGPRRLQSVRKASSATAAPTLANTGTD